MDKKHIIAYYTIADYDKEEKWLNSMSNGGWNLIKNSGILYTFEKGTPGEYFYKLDLPNEQMTEGEVDEYYKFLDECDIEVVCTYKSWRYLRKRRETGPFTLSDNTLSKLVMVNKAYGMASRIMNTIIAIVAIIIGLSVLFMQFVPTRIFNFLEGLIIGISTSSIVALAIIFIPITQRLRQRLNRLIDDVQIKN
jgi:hypothetical protein